MTIHHMSIAAQNPQHVAEVLAEIFQGQSVPFPPHPGSYMALAMDKNSTAIEVYPLGSQLMPGSGSAGVSFGLNHQPWQFSAIHAAISVPTSQAEIERIGGQLGWRVIRCSRDSFFDVIEFWIENTFLVEFLSPEMTGEFLAAMQDPALLKYMLS